MKFFNQLKFISIGIIAFFISSKLSMKPTIISTAAEAPKVTSETYIKVNNRIMDYNVYWTAQGNNIGFQCELVTQQGLKIGKPKLCFGSFCLQGVPEDSLFYTWGYTGLQIYTDYLYNNIDYYANYTTLAIATITAFFFVSSISVISRIYPENASYTSDMEQSSSYECGFAPFNNLERPQLFLFYKLAIFFIIFEAELIFLYPWVISLFSQLDSNGIFFINSFPFFIVIFAGFYYEINEEALDL